MVQPERESFSTQEAPWRFSTKIPLCEEASLCFLLLVLGLEKSCSKTGVWMFCCFDALAAFMERLCSSLHQNLISQFTRLADCQLQPTASVPILLCIHLLNCLHIYDGLVPVQHAVFLISSTIISLSSVAMGLVRKMILNVIFVTVDVW
jgi:hypothetical protein